MAKKILIIEDEEAIAELYRIVFVRRGYEVVVAHDGEVGLSEARTHHPDMILVDIMMPKMNGLQVVKYLKEDASLAAIPVYVLSNLTDPLTEHAMMQAGAIRYIVKSDHLPDQIVDMIDAFFRPAA